MKKLKIFPKMFIQIFSVLSIIVLLIHISIYLIFPLSSESYFFKVIDNKRFDNLFICKIKIILCKYVVLYHYS